MLFAYDIGFVARVLRADTAASLSHIWESNILILSKKAFRLLDDKAYKQVLYIVPT
jgi:hypothetical protein